MGTRPIRNRPSGRTGIAVGQGGITNVGAKRLALQPQSQR